MKDQDNRSPERVILRILSPREGNVMPSTFQVAGSSSASNSTEIAVSISGVSEGTATVQSEAWSSQDITRDPGYYSARAEYSTANATINQFEIEDEPGIEISSLVVVEIVLGQEYRHVTFSGNHTSNLGPAISGKLFDKSNSHVMDHTSSTVNGQNWELRFEQVDVGYYAVEVTRHINDQRITTSMVYHVA